ncbi:N,N-dimethylformamidase beta subunit family domain-containing protein [Nonomuraea typhae]|uniref:N,N-dimethylformamidase beta subunit family domain-containing protein n=1 Tax=Nonomuraea typhae TaxID=2603600 RepID=UPI0012FB9733|nr:N,N-dimethylformamidase beta subunit family domain-containing protein [Nonomuraea typhae]
MLRTIVVIFVMAAGCAGNAMVTPPSAPAPPPAEAAPPPAADWQITEQGAEHEIEGFADRVSVLPGERFRLRVSTTAPRFTATAFRMGATVTRVWASGEVRGEEQPPPRAAAGDMVTAAHWKPSLEVATDGWPEGAYLLRLDASSGAQRYVPITVRSASARGKVVLVNAVTTWQAYNRWGGRSLYKGPDLVFGSRSLAVSFDRPYDFNGARQFLELEKDAIQVAERSGVRLAYLTSHDLRPGILDGARAVISMGHDEYWSPEMRAVVTKARDRGTNLAFLGANAVYWRIQLKDRVLECDKVKRCLHWRDSKPESSLVGQMYDCFPAEATYIVRRPRHWIFQGTRGRRFPGMAGVETDKVSRGSPRDLEVLAESPVNCAGRRTVSHSTYYVARSGAGVFSAGTMRWVCGMAGRHCGHGVPDAAAPFTRRATTNILTRFAKGPAGRL